MHRFGVAVLGVLNQEHHQKSDNGCSGINNELPRIGEMKDRSSHAPDQNDQKRNDKAPGLPRTPEICFAKVWKASSIWQTTLSSPSAEVVVFFLVVTACRRERLILLFLNRADSLSLLYNLFASPHPGIGTRAARSIAYD